MKNFFLSAILIILVTICFAGCEENIVPDIEKKLAGSDKVTIYFYEEGTSKVTDPDKIVTIELKSVIDSIVSSIENIDALDYKCGYNGTIEFFENRKPVFVSEFNFQSECAHFVFRHNKKMFTKKMSEHGRLILTDYFSRTHNKALK